MNPKITTSKLDTESKDDLLFDENLDDCLAALDEEEIGSKPKKEDMQQKSVIPAL